MEKMNCMRSYPACGYKAGLDHLLRATLDREDGANWVDIGVRMSWNLAQELLKLELDRLWRGKDLRRD